MAAEEPGGIPEDRAGGALHEDELVVVVGRPPLRIRPRVVEADLVDAPRHEQERLGLAHPVVLVDPRQRAAPAGDARHLQPVLLGVASARVPEPDHGQDAASGLSVVVRVGRVAVAGSGRGTGRNPRRHGGAASARDNADLHPVRDAVAVRVGVQRVRPPHALLRVREPVAVRVGVRAVRNGRVEAVARLPAVVHAVAVRVGLQRVRAEGEFRAVREAVAVRVRHERVGAQAGEEVEGIAA